MPLAVNRCQLLFLGMPNCQLLFLGMPNYFPVSSCLEEKNSNENFAYFRNCSNALFSVTACKISKEAKEGQEKYKWSKILLQ